MYECALMIKPNRDPALPRTAKIIARIQECPTIFTLKTQFVDEKISDFSFVPGQFNMIYLYGVGEVAISISSDPAHHEYISHTIRAVGRVTKALQTLRVGENIGLRGPYGQGWPLERAQGKDIVVVTGGLGCAPTASVINYILARRKDYGAIKILQGVKHSDDFIFRKQYALWKKNPNTDVFVAADKAGPKWPWATGYITDMITSLTLRPFNTIVLMCGPEGMMHAAIQAFLQINIPEEAIYLSVERNMQCGIGHCGHCQLGGFFVCKDGPIFAYPSIKNVFSLKGF